MLSWAARLSYPKSTFSVSIAEAEVYEPNSFVVSDQQILRLEVTMDNVEAVNVLDAAYDLLKDSTCLFFGYSA